MIDYMFFITGHKDNVNCEDKITKNIYIMLRVFSAYSVSLQYCVLYIFPFRLIFYLMKIIDYNNNNK